MWPTKHFFRNQLCSLSMKVLTHFFAEENFTHRISQWSEGPRCRLPTPQPRREASFIWQRRPLAGWAQQSQAEGSPAAARAGRGVAPDLYHSPNLITLENETSFSAASCKQWSAYLPLVRPPLNLTQCCFVSRSLYMCFTDNLLCWFFLWLMLVDGASLHLHIHRFGRWFEFCASLASFAVRLCCFQLWLAFGLFFFVCFSLHFVRFCLLRQNCKRLQNCKTLYKCLNRKLCSLWLCQTKWQLFYNKADSFICHLKRKLWQDSHLSIWRNARKIFVLEVLHLQVPERLQWRSVGIPL